MRIRYHEPLGDKHCQQDPLPKHWREIARGAPFEPQNFGIVAPGRLYRSAIVWAHQVPILQEEYGIENIVTLIDGDWLREYYPSPDITIHQFPFHQRRALTFERVRTIVDVIDGLSRPTVVCCLKGATRTGMVVAGYEVMHRRQSPFAAALRSIPYGNVNISSLREIVKYTP